MVKREYASKVNIACTAAKDLFIDEKISAKSENYAWMQTRNGDFAWYMKLGYYSKSDLE